MTDSLDRLYRAVLAARTADPAVSRTARLLRAGRGKMAKKLAEEAVEVVIDAMNGHNEAVVRESADLIYNLVVLWVASGINPSDVWAEMDRRERLLGIAEKLPKGLDEQRAAGRCCAASQDRRDGPQSGAQAALTAAAQGDRECRNNPPSRRPASPACCAASTTGASTPPASRTRRG